MIERGFTYRTTDPVQNLKLRLTVRQVQGAATGAQVTHLLKWQEKKFAPWELAKMSYYCAGHAQGDGGNKKEYIRRMRTSDATAPARCLEDLEKHGIYVYTCVCVDCCLLNPGVFPLKTSPASPSAGT